MPEQKTIDLTSLIADMITQNTAANMLGVTRQTVHSLVRRGHLTQYLIDGVPFVSRSEVQIRKNSRLPIDTVSN